MRNRERVREKYQKSKYIQIGISHDNHGETKNLHECAIALDRQLQSRETQ